MRGLTTPLAVPDLEQEIARIACLNKDALRALWQKRNGGEPPKALSKDLVVRALVHSLQEEQLGKLPLVLRKQLAGFATGGVVSARHVKSGSVIIREYQGQIHEVVVVPEGFLWQGEIYTSLSIIARTITGTSWNGPRFFGLRGKAEQRSGKAKGQGQADTADTECKSVADVAGTRAKRSVVLTKRQNMVEVGSERGRAAAVARIQTSGSAALETEATR